MIATATAAPAGAQRVIASPAQQALWLAAQSDPTGAAYNISLGLRIGGQLDVEALLVDRHVSLRTTFQWTDGLQQIVQPPPADDPLPLEALDAAGGDADTLLATTLKEAASTVLDVERGPLFRGRLFRLGPESHVLSLTVHHLVCDGWSLGLLARELAAAYDAFSSGHVPALDPVRVQYTDYAESLQPSAADLAADLQYWRVALDGLTPGLSMPFDFVRPADPSGRGGRVSRPVSRGLSAAIRAFARRQQTTPFVVLLSAFAAFLHRWGGADDVAIGTPIAGRDGADLERVVGPFVNTVVPRFAIDDETSFDTIVAQGRAQMLAALAHGRAPIGDVLRALQPPRIAGVHPVFQVLCAWQKQPALALRGLTCTPLESRGESAKVDLTLFLNERAEGSEIAFEFNRDLFEEQTVSSGLAAFERLLTAALSSPSAPIAQIPWLSSEERAAILAAGAGPVRPYPRDANLAALFLEQAHRRPTHAAVEDGAGVLSYTGLAQLAALAARQLRDAGVGEGDTVALLCPPDRTLPAGMLAVLALGAMYVPIDPSNPHARIRGLLEGCGARAVIGPRAVEALGGGLPFIAMDIPVDGASPLLEVRTSSGGGAAASVMYTSGSTGSPKGVIVPHRAIARLVVNPDYIDITRDDRIALAANPSFDASTFEVWSALLNGGTLVALDAETMSSPRALGRAVRDRRLTLMLLTTAAFNRVAASQPDAFSSLRAVLFGGEAGDPAATARVRDACPALRLVNVYGPTENATFSAVYAVDRIDLRPLTVPIGYPIASSTAYVLDGNLEPVPNGVVGELYLGGDGLALGYLREPELTAARFIASPFAAGERLYRSGDRCRVTASGALEFVGRVDRQVKLRGFRIELEEIEGVLLQHPAVIAAVADIAGEGDGRTLVAYVASPAGVDPGELREWVAARLPAYEVPARVTVLRELPLTPTGKIDRAALARDAGEPAVPRTVRAPRDPLEAELAAIWRDVLGVDSIGIDDDFFALGGHSLLAAEMMDRAEALFGRRVPLGVLLRHPTIEQLAGAFWRAASESPVAPLRESGSRPPLFFAHGDVNGGGMYCARMVRALPDDQPFYALSPAIGHGGRPASIEEAAAECEAWIERLHPTGPLALGGYCHGALIAYELARRLSSRRQVTRVLLVHPSPVEPRLRVVDRMVRAVCRWRGFGERERVALMVRTVQAFGFARQATGAQRAAWLRHKMRSVLSGRHRTPSEKEGEMLSATPAAVRHDDQVWDAVLRAVIAYVPRGYDGEITVLTAAESDGDTDRGWASAARRCHALRVPGTHQTCVTTHLPALAAAVVADLEAV